MNQTPYFDDFGQPESDDDLQPELSDFDDAAFDPQDELPGLFEGQDDALEYLPRRAQSQPGQSIQPAFQAARQVETVELLDRLQDHCGFDEHVKLLGLECGLDLERGNAAIAETFRQLLALGVAASQAGNEEEVACLAAAAAPLGLQLFPTSGKRLFPLLPVLSVGMSTASRTLYRAAANSNAARAGAEAARIVIQRPRAALQLLPLALFRTLIILHQRSQRGEVLTADWAAGVFGRELQRVLGGPGREPARGQAPVRRANPASPGYAEVEPPAQPRQEKDRSTIAAAAHSNGKNGRKPGPRRGPSQAAPAASEW